MMNERLKKYRVELDLTQRYVADLIGVPRSTISAIEGNTRKVSTDELKLFSEIYGVSTDEILYGQQTDISDIKMFARSFGDLSNNDKKEIINLINFKKKLKG